MNLLLFFSDRKVHRKKIKKGMKDERQDSLGPPEVICLSGGGVEEGSVQLVFGQPCAQLLQSLRVTLLHTGLCEHPVLVPWGEGEGGKEEGRENL